MLKIIASGINEKNNTTSDDCPIEFLCPITMSPMVTPVIDQFGHVYEKEALLHWLRDHDSSPLNRGRYSIPLCLIPADELRGKIIEWATQTNYKLPSPLPLEPIFTQEDYNVAGTYINCLPTRLWTLAEQSAKQLLLQTPDSVIDSIFSSLVFTPSKVQAILRDDLNIRSEYITYHALERYYLLCASSFSDQVFEKAASFMSQQLGPTADELSKRIATACKIVTTEKASSFFKTNIDSVLTPLLKEKVYEKLKEISASAQ